jgi:hypothetical protein
MTTAPVEDWYRSIGEFVVAFEHACGAARTFVLHYLPGNSGEDQDKKITVLRTLGAKQLADTVRTLLDRTGRYGEEEEAALSNFGALIERRNVVVHSAWFIGWAPEGESTEASSVTAMGPSRKLNGPAWAVRRLDFEELRADIEKAKKVRTGLMRLLHHCFTGTA